MTKRPSRHEDYRFYMMCAGSKKCYKKKSTADKDLKRMKAKGIHLSPIINIYKCNYCNYYHIGHNRRLLK